MDPLIIIPARLGSEGIPGKNFQILAGMSPVNRAIHCARAVVTTNIVVTTDCLDAAILHTPPGTTVHPRPAHLATATTQMADVVLDVLRTIPGPARQPVLLLQPTQPLRQPAHLEQALRLLASGAHSVASVVETEPAGKLYYAGFRPVTGGCAERRQDCPPTYACDGTVYAFRRGQFLANRCFHTVSHTRMLIIPAGETCRLDTINDWVVAELRLRALASTP